MISIKYNSNLICGSMTLNYVNNLHWENDCSVIKDTLGIL